MDTAATAAAVARRTSGSAGAEARSLAPLLRPAQRRGGRRAARRHAASAARCSRAIVAGGFTGELYAVHPAGQRRRGEPGVPAARSTCPGPSTSSSCAVPAARCSPRWRTRRGAGVSGRRRDLLGLRRARGRGRACCSAMLEPWRAPHSIRLVGPNCLGRDGQPTRTSGSTPPSPAWCRRRAGWRWPRSPAASASRCSTWRGRSGSGVALVRLAGQQGRRVRATTCSPPGCDDPEVTAAALYLESFGNALQVRPVRPPVRRAQAAAGRRRRPLRGRPPGRAPRTPPPPRRRPVGVDALFAQAGVIACRGARGPGATPRCLLTEQPLPPGRGSRWSATPAASACWPRTRPTGWGWWCPSCRPSCATGSARHVTGDRGIGNPVDLGAGGLPPTTRPRCDPLLGSDEVDAVVVGAGRRPGSPARLRLIGRSPGRAPAHRERQAAAAGARMASVDLGRCRLRRAVFESAENAAPVALAHAAALRRLARASRGPSEPADARAGRPRPGAGARPAGRVRRRTAGWADRGRRRAAGALRPRPRGPGRARPGRGGWPPPRSWATRWF